MLKFIDVLILGASNNSKIRPDIVHLTFEDGSFKPLDVIISISVPVIHGLLNYIATKFIQVKQAEESNIFEISHSGILFYIIFNHQ